MPRFNMPFELGLFDLNEIFDNVFPPEDIKNEIPDLPYNTFIHLVSLGVSDEFVSKMDEDIKKRIF